MRPLSRACRRRAGPVLAGVLLTCVQIVLPRQAVPRQDRPYVAVVDRDMTPAAGAIDLLTIQRALADVEDRWLPPSRFDETRAVTRTLGVGYRFAKWYGLDLAQDHFLMVVGHEVFGHGSRLREVTTRGISYGFDVPIPYGPGGGVTRFQGAAEVTRADVLAIDTSGIEAQNVLAGFIATEAIAAGAFHYREAWQYIESRIAGLNYIRSVSPRSSEGHDVRSFLEDFNEDCDPPACAGLTASTLKHRALAMLADPMLGYAGYAWAVSYLARGRASGPVPMIALPYGLRYLPALRFEMTPYGTAVTTDHYVVSGGRLTTVSIGVGDTGRDRAWHLGVSTTRVVERAWLSGDVALAVWRQPELDASPNEQRLMTGVLGMVRARLPLWRTSPPAMRTSLFVEAGYKSDGFVRGERLHAGPIVRLGVILQPPRAAASQ